MNALPNEVFVSLCDCSKDVAVNYRLGLTVSGSSMVIEVNLAVSSTSRRAIDNSIEQLPHTKTYQIITKKPFFDALGFFNKTKSAPFLSMPLLWLSWP